jgi:LmbE family N-acetylglucosaminyl deacetylase
MKKLLFVFIFFNICFFSKSQSIQNKAEYLHAVSHLHQLGRVLYLAAHPDDENTTFIAWSSKIKGYEIGYLSLTRGDGGQNLIGNEIQSFLGVVRSEELIEARKIDGGRQFFTRAFDFGYSKSEKETYQKWNDAEVLADIVYVIRYFQPDVIVTRFSPDLGKTHGHHTASAQMAVKAAQLAADKNYVIPQKNLSPFTVNSVYWNTSPWFFRENENFDKSQLLSFDIGAYDENLGLSVGEISAKSRSCHSSQGFGSAARRGEIIEYFQHLWGYKAQKDIFENCESSFLRLGNIAKPIQQQINKFQKNIGQLTTQQQLKELIKIRNSIFNLPASVYRDDKLKKIEELLKYLTGFHLIFQSNQTALSQGETHEATLKYVLRNADSVQINFCEILQNQSENFQKINLNNVLNFKAAKRNVLSETKVKFTTASNMNTNRHYWLTEKENDGIFFLANRNLLEIPKNTGAIQAIVQYTLFSANEKIVMVERYPLIYQKVDPSKGERFKTLEVLPSLTFNFTENVLVFKPVKSEKVSISVKSFSNNVEDEVYLNLPSGWKSNPEKVELKFSEKYQTQMIEFTVTPNADATSGEISLQSKMFGKNCFAFKYIGYDHIEQQHVLYPSAVKALLLNHNANKKIAYLQGSGDDVPAGLKQLGYQLTEIQADEKSFANLSQFEAVVIGIRAFNVHKTLKFLQTKLNEYAENGGNLIIQYNTTGDLDIAQIGPYPLKISRDRITDEKCKVKILQPQHVVFQYPYKIGEKDFEGWIQERGLYFPNEWSDKYVPMLEMADPDEKPLKGALLIAPHGKGNVVYTGLSFFREIPEGVEAAYKLLTNIIEIKKNGQ